jgi:nitroreductase
MIKNLAKKVFLIIDVTFIKVLSLTPVSSSLYYFLFSSKFRREHQSVLKARIKYYADGNESSALLRRNIHRLEKGLSMIPLREIFAQDYIQQTVEAFSTSTINKKNENTLKWCFDVLKQYFEKSKPNAINIKLKTVFQESSIFLYFEGQNDEPKHPFLYGMRTTETTYEQFLSLAKSRHSVRWYEDGIVDKETVDQCINAASAAPSACNRQPFKYMILQDKNKVNQIASLAMGTGGFASNLTNLVVVTGDLSAYPFERDRHVIYIDASLSSMLLMLAFKSKGIDSCPINWPDIEVRERKISDALNLPIHQRVIMLIAFGYGEEQVLIPYSEKKSKFELSEYL